MVAADRLEQLVAAIFRGTGSAPEEAEEVARHLVEADLTGHASHGVTQVEIYVRSQRLGHLQPNRHAEIVRDDPPFLVVDGGIGFGQVIAREAIDLASERAKAAGVSILALRYAHHIGRLGAYGERCAAAGLIAILFANVVSIPRVAPFGGARSRLGTNPICIAFPATPRNPPVLVDFATSAIAGNKCRIAMAKGEEVAEGLLQDADGNPTRDPGVIFSEPAGSLRPFGGHKGYGLALACEILAGAIASGVPTLPQNLRAGRFLNNALAFVFDPTRIAGTQWQDLTDSVLENLRDTPPSPGSDGVLIPGEPEAQRRRVLQREGVPVDPVTMAALHRIGGELGLDVTAQLFG
ncbi:malate/lactate/ureidoglycolate dehydrogenase [Rhodovastum atsumiense]|uniref:Malate/lactate/ureidoglycolate dehydrogenase n=1 Tax=Rhodovastum atsumiense TaxID=504468 RepID=A0A5M6IKJ1_9PROT|nr:malate/lactate/ureidoglycolate dehydrogenase [Rhodovastum atsumiense]